MTRMMVPALLALLLFGCVQKEEAPTPPPSAKQPSPPSVFDVESPSGAGAAEPFLFATTDSIVMSWLEPVAGSNRTALRFARFRDGKWSAPRTVVERDDLFVNWADFPSVVEDARGALFAHWLQKSGGETYAYDVRMTTSPDGGQTWLEPFLLNRDGKKGEHGFVSLSPVSGGGVAAIWLDSRRMKAPEGHGDEGTGDMTLRYAHVDASGAIESDSELDARTCECCTTGMAITTDGPLVAYRDRSPEEIRDIAVVTGSKSGWSQPALVHADGWRIEGCPVNGPQVDASGRLAGIAWFSAAGDTPRVDASFTGDHGRTFGTAIRVDDGHPVGRVDIVVLDDDSALVTWIETKGAAAEIRARRVHRNGQVDPSFKVGESSASRAAGFPRIARLGSDVYVGWTTATAKEKSIRVAKIRM